ncbi:uncharacterized protein L969DRAFT_61535 [Mixia osmundae IAM 14324]|uniref:Uncharacterized protein n=1 Tax=Mixia osmundae (strain CBS 9802 / IAM 14324 / JCM 22182 / KY 12970) TaxID=764103 RepID=G7E6H0_MIXOS|nr:uncharacterized protein L969DRAFT_61535 [Mixia osmundae IAM 14324]KEI40413.1 hypothetical protein L969DRAFT_61535 [Mixia osmundae IAM 14324]GAA98430.1 hypothetical protein E5Q_05116 [Mixia osmundae IAM 14324]
MASTLATKIGRKVLGDHLKTAEPADPRYETYTNAKGKQKRRNRPMPEGLTKQEQKILGKIRRRARRLDRGFSLCGFRFGYTAILGLIPVVGDVADLSLSYYLVIKPATKCDLPNSLKQHMLFNQAVATGIGIVPIVGDIAYAAWKPNSRNAFLFEEFLIKRAAKGGAAAGHEHNQAAAQQTVQEAKAPGGASKKSSWWTANKATHSDGSPAGDRAHESHATSADLAAPSHAAQTYPAQPAPTPARAAQPATQQPTAMR